MSTPSATFVALDVETANPDYSSICSIGAARFNAGELTGTFATLINPETYFDDLNVRIHGITPEMVEGQPRMPAVTSELERFVGRDVVASP